MVQKINKQTKDELGIQNSEFRIDWWIPWTTPSIKHCVVNSYLEMNLDRSIWWLHALLQMHKIPRKKVLPVILKNKYIFSCCSGDILSDTAFWYTVRLKACHRWDNIFLLGGRLTNQRSVNFRSKLSCSHLNH